MNETCRRLRELLAETMANPAAATEADDLQRHLESCPDCRAHHEALQQDHLQLAAFARSMDAKLANLEDKVMESVSRNLDEAAVRPRVEDRERNFWQSAPLRWGLAAAVLVAVVLGLNLMDRGGPAGIAWAQVIEKVAAAEDYICRMRRETNLAPDMDLVQYTSATYGVRQDLYVDDKLSARIFVDPEARQTVIIVDKRQGYAFMDMSDEEVERALAGARPETFVERFRGLDFDEIGLRDIDGATASGIETTADEIAGAVFDEGSIRLWVDVETQWPVRLEYEGTTEDGARSKTTMTDFQWDARLSAADFAYEIPEGYENMGTVARPEINEESALHGLRTFALLMEGRYPRRLVLASAIREFEDEEDDLRRRGILDDHDIADLLSIRESCEFFTLMETEDRDPAYHGDTVGRADFDKVLLRWRLDDGDYRVVYGDLRQETISSARLAELENRR